MLPSISNLHNDEIALSSMDRNVIEYGLSICCILCGVQTVFSPQANSGHFNLD